jgi:hypothetical protein
MPLTAEQQRKALHSIAEWRSNGQTQQARCPACWKPGLTIIDRSARPHAEWYALACADCGLNETVHIPLSAPVQTLD